jgi:peptide/nickel transport system substrate-binding protein
MMPSPFQLTRRELLKSAAAAGFMLALPGGVFAQAEPKRGGLFKIGCSNGATSDSIDPATFSAGPAIYAMLGGCCNNLVEIDADGNVVAELAESWEPSPDAKTWTFQLRQGVTFTNGKPLTAEDVIASYNHHRGAESKSAAKSILESVSDIRSDGPAVVVFELVEGNADFPFVAADYHLIVLQASADGKLDWESGIGTGGYTLEEFEAGVRIRLKRRADYWKSDRAWFDEVELLVINDATARQNALVTGEVDAIDRVDLKTVALLARRPDINIEEVTGTAHYTIPMHCDVAPFSDVNVRLALKYAIDREELVQKILRGHGRVAKDNPIAPPNRFFADDLEPHAFDPDKARFYLKQAGMDSLQVELSAADSAFEGAVDCGVLFKESAAKAGIEITVKREPNDGYWSNVWLKKPFCFSYWNGRPTEDWMFTMVYARGTEWNESHWDNARFNELLVSARSELDESKRREMYREMQMLVSEDGGSIIPMYNNYVDASSTRVAHAKLASNNFLDGWKIVERWWSAE